MMNEREQLQRIQELAREIMEMLLQESLFDRNSYLRDSVEHLANTVDALTKIQLDQDVNVQDTLRYTITKMRIARNAMQHEKETKKNLA
ncbi:LemA domain protein [Ectobacillus sp. JY-23]|uniref:LemA domain protein n=1 Tax=Ectobacillus sp. JY-23 TaxID=2933872 RepID=UPI001FF6E510|nr:LemA domain protein [Ectobacillus sp. JY-23]UOY92932.1 LemA domain protein [Ectobacillus sp. JY-23]